jgi:hypothetical protein
MALTKLDSSQIFGLKILQVVSSDSTTPFSTTSNTFQTTNTTCTITPTSSTSRILILATGMMRSANPSVAACYASLFRGGTNLGGGSDGGFLVINSYTFATSAYTANGSMTYLDSPATTGSTTYSVKIMNDNNSTTVSYNAAQRSSMTLIEVGA